MANYFSLFARRPHKFAAYQCSNVTEATSFKHMSQQTAHRADNGMVINYLIVRTKAYITYTCNVIDDLSLLAASICEFIVARFALIAVRRESKRRKHGCGHLCPHLTVRVRSHSFGHALYLTCSQACLDSQLLQRRNVAQTTRRENMTSSLCTRSVTI